MLLVEVRSSVDNNRHSCADCVVMASLICVPVCNAYNRKQLDQVLFEITDALCDVNDTLVIMLENALLNMLNIIYI